MENKPLLIIHNTEDHNWKSCRELEKSLFNSYHSFCRTQGVFIDLSKNEEVSVPQNGTVVIITHKLTSQFYEALKKVSKEKHSLSIIWHVFGNLGNLFINAPFLNDILINFPIKMVAASSAQARRIYYYLKETKADEIEILPFGADTTAFGLKSAKENKNTRSSYSLKDSDFVVCYAGRLSFQKNISLLVKLFAEFAAKHQQAHLLLCGNFDDLGFPEVGLRLGNNAYQSQIMKSVDSLPKNIRERIIFTGNLEKDELASVLSASDLFISLSTYILEDFGLTPAQALLSGIPVLLSNWGGFQEVKKQFQDHSSLVGIQLKDEELLIDSEGILEALSFYSSNKMSLQEKSALAKKASEIYSVTALSKEIKNILSKTNKDHFLGFRKDLLKFSTPELKKLHLKIQLSHVQKLVESYLSDDNTLKRKSSYSITKDWSDFLINLYKGHSELRPLERQELAQHWPAYREFYDRYLNVYAFQIESLEQVKAHEFVILRDGVIGAQAFFSLHRHPIKKSFLKIGLNLKLRNLIEIPSGWKKHVCWYANNYSAVKKNVIRRLLFIANSSTELSADAFLSISNTNYQKKYFVNGENEISDLELEILKNQDIYFLSWGKFLNIQDFSHFDFIDKENLLYSTKNYASDYLADRGARNASIQMETSGLKILRRTRASAFREIIFYQEKG